MITIITKARCKPCEIMKIILKENNIKFNILNFNDINKLPLDQKRVIASYYKLHKGLPILLKNKKPIFYGLPFSNEEILAVIK